MGPWSGLQESLLDLRTEESVRAVLDDYNHRVKVDRLRPVVGNLPPLLARTVDVDDLVAQWHALRVRSSQVRATALRSAKSRQVSPGQKFLRT